MDRVVRNFKQWTGIGRTQNPEVARSHYSLVSTTELTAGAVELWNGLPPEVKYDPSLASLQQLYEKEHGKADLQSKARNGVSKKRLPSVSSAPHLNSNIIRSEANDNQDQHVGIEINTTCNGERNIHDQNASKKPSKMVQARSWIKMTMLLACWFFFTIAFILYSEKVDETRNTFVAPGETKSYILDIPENQLSLMLKLSGPFISEQAESMNNSKEDRIQVWLERWVLKNNEEKNKENNVESVEESQSWFILLQPDKELDFNTGEERTQALRITSNNTETNQSSVYAIRMRSTATQTTPLTMKYTVNPLDSSTGVIYGCLLLCALYGLIIFEVINRTMAAVIVSTAALGVLSVVGERPSLPELVSWLDMETLLLLFSMMLLVAIMAETGMFDHLAVYTFEITKGKLWPLITLLCAMTALVSTVLDNVTTVLLMTPVTIRSVQQVLIIIWRMKNYRLQCSLPIPMMNEEHDCLKFILILVLLNE